jgi:MFS family permease
VHFASSAPAAIFPLYVERLCANPEYATLATGVIISVTGFAAAVAAWFLGKLSDEWGHKKMLITCAIIAGLVTIPQAFCRNVTELFILRVLLGAAAAGVLPSANAIIRDVSPSEMYGTAYGAMSSVAALGFATGPLAGGFLAATYGLWSTFILSGLLLLLVAAYAALAVRQTKAPSAEGVPQRGFSPTLASTAVTAEPEVASPDSPRR